MNFDKLRKEEYDHGYKVGYVKGYEAAKKDFERPQGKWIFEGVYHDKNNPIDNDMYYCNLCKRSIMTACEIPTVLFPFCHCGAKMENGGKDKHER